MIRAALFLLLLTFARFAPAQLLYDYLSKDLSADILRKDQINMNLMIDRMLAQHLAMQDLMMLQAFGQERIAAGQASMTYAPSDKGSILSDMEPAHRANAKSVLAAFAAALKDKKLVANDVADCHGLGGVLSYYGYWGEDPGTQRLQRLSAQSRATLMADAAFQGMADYRRQRYCERVAFLAMLSAAARNEAQRTPAGPEQDGLIRRAQQSAAAALKDVWTNLPIETAELVPDGFGNRFARQAKEGTGSFTFRRKPVSRATQSADGVWGAGTGSRWVAKFNALVQQQGGSENALPDVWATGYAWLVHLRERGKVSIGANGWRAARDHMSRWALAQPGWLQKTDDERQYFADDMAIRVAQLLEAQEANRRALAAPQKVDPITGVVWNPVVDQSASLAEKAAEAIAKLFVAEERPQIERLLLQRGTAQ